MTTAADLYPVLKCEDRRPYAHWRIHGVCNLRCPYCFFDRMWPEIHEDGQYRNFPVSVWEKFWDRMHARHGSFQINITGGEPFMYKDMREIIALLSPRHTVDFCTNLTWNVRDWAPRMDPAKVGIHASFHPYFHALDGFVEKLLFVRDRGFPTLASILAYPTLLAELEGWAARFEREGLDWLVRPYIGEYEGRRYPASYTDDEARLIKSLVRLSSDDCARLRLYSPPLLVRLNEAGQRCFRIDADGVVRNYDKQSNVVGWVGEAVALEAAAS